MLPIAADDVQQDLTFCYLHMTQHDLDVIDTIGRPDYISGELSDTGSCQVAQNSTRSDLRDIFFS